MSRVSLTQLLYVDGIIALLVLFGLVGMLEEPGSSRYATPDAANFDYARPRKLGTLQNGQVVESSGIVASRRMPGVFWTHNDSGDSPRIFAFDTRGTQLATVTIEGVRAVDWEDIACFTRNGKHFLVIGDVGDNLARHSESCLYLIAEPDLRDHSVPCLQTIRFRFDDGSHNCESLAVDSELGVALLVTKIRGSTSHVYELALPDSLETGTHVARQIGTIAISLTTAMDVSRDGRRAVILTYGNAFEFSRLEHESWSQAFARSGRELEMPYRFQGESICYGPDDHSLFLTSERIPTPFWMVPLGSPRKPVAR